MEIQKSNSKNKKYVATFKDGTKINFGDKRYEHYKDQTGLNLYSKKDHGDKSRRKNYLKRHAQTKESLKRSEYLKLIEDKYGKKSASYLSAALLWIMCTLSFII